MKNKEKYQKELANIAISGCQLAINKFTLQPSICTQTKCVECLLCENDICRKIKIVEWANSEYKENNYVKD